MPFLDGLLKCCFDVVLYWRLRKDKYQEKCTCTEGGHDSTCFGRRTHIPTLVDVHLCLRGEHCYAVHCFNNTVETVRKCCFYPPLVFPLRSLSILLFSPGYLRSHICVHVLSAFTTDSLHFSSSARCSCLVEHRHPGTYAEKHACTHTRARTRAQNKKALFLNVTLSTTFLQFVYDYIQQLIPMAIFLLRCLSLALTHSS